MARHDYGYMAKIGVDGSGMAAGLKEIDERLEETDNRLKTTQQIVENMEAAGADTSDALQTHLQTLGEAIDATETKLQALSEIQTDLKADLEDRHGTVTRDDYLEYNNTLTETAARLQELKKQYDALAESMSEEAKAEKESRDAALSYKDTIAQANETLSTNQARLAAIKAERDAGRGSIDDDIEALRIYHETLAVTRAKLEELEEQELAVDEAFRNGTISQDEYEAFEKELADTAEQFKNLQKNADEAGESTLQLGDIIKADLISSAIKAGLNALVDVFKQLANEAKEVVEQAAAMGDTIDKQSQRLGMSNEAYQEWDYILSQNGANISSLTGVMKNLSNQIDDLENGSKKATSAFKELGLSYSDLEGKTGEEQLSIIIERLQKIDDETQRNAVANDVLGRSYQQLIPLLNEDAATIEELRQKAHDTNQIMSDEAVDAAVSYTDAMDTLSRSFDGFENKIGAELLPGITKVVEGFTDLINGVDGADEKIRQGIDDIMASADRIAPMIEELVDRIGEAVGDKAPEVILSLAEKLIEAVPGLIDAGLAMGEQLIQSLGDSLPELLPKIVQFVVDLALAIIDHTSELVEAGGDLTQGLIDGLLNAIPKLLEAVPVIITKLVAELLKVAEEHEGDGENDFGRVGLNVADYIQKSIVKGLYEYDWTASFDKISKEMADAWLNSDFSGFEDIGAKIAQVIISALASTFIDNPVVDIIMNADKYIGWGVDIASERLEQQADEAKEIIDEKAEETADEVEKDTARMEQAMAEYSRKKGEYYRKYYSQDTKAADDALAAMEETWDKYYHWDKKNQEAYWEEKRRYLAEHKVESEAWWKAYNETEKHFSDKEAKEQKAADAAAKKAKTEAEKKAREAAAEKKKAEKAIKDAEKARIKAEKEALEEAYTAIETEQYKKGYDDGWRLDRQKEYLDTLDKESDLYKEYYAKWLKDTATFDKKVEDAYEKEYKKLADAGKKAAEAHLKEYEAGIKDILKAVDKPQVVEALTNPLGLVERKTGDPSIDNNKKKKQRLILSDYKSKIAELKEYQKNLDKLGTLGLSKAHLQEIFEMDFDTRALYIKELLQMSAAQRSKYLKDYEQYTQMAGTVSDTEMQYKAFEIVDSMGEALDQATDNAYVKGQEAAEAYYSGYKGYMKNTDLEDIDLNPYTGGYETEHKRNATIKALTDTAMSASAGAFDAVKGNLTINVAGKAAITATIGDLLKKLKNSGGVIDV